MNLFCPFDQKMRKSPYIYLPIDRTLKNSVVESGQKRLKVKTPGVNRNVSHLFM